MKDLYTWNKACSLRLVWLLFFRPDSVWVSLFKEVILKGSIQNYWTTEPKSSYSWLVNKLLKLKSVAYTLIILRVQNGRTGRFWTDNWSPYGCLETFLDAGTTRLGIPTSATIASLYRNGSWRIPSARSVFFTTINLTEDPDFYEWHINGKTSLKFNGRRLLGLQGGFRDIVFIAGL